MAAAVAGIDTKAHHPWSAIRARRNTIAATLLRARVNQLEAAQSSNVQTCSNHHRMQGDTGHIPAKIHLPSRDGRIGI